MTIKIGDRLATGVLTAFIDAEKAGGTPGPNVFKVDDLIVGIDKDFPDETLVDFQLIEGQPLEVEER